MKIYKIRNQEGLYSTGGSYVHWTKMGKTWQNLAHLKCHLAMLGKHLEQTYKDCKIVTFEIIEVDSNPVIPDDKNK